MRDYAASIYCWLMAFGAAVAGLPELGLALVVLSLLVSPRGIDIGCAISMRISDLPLPQLVALGLSLLSLGALCLTMVEGPSYRSIWAYPGAAMALIGLSNLTLAWDSHHLTLARQRQEAQGREDARRILAKLEVARAERLQKAHEAELAELVAEQAADEANDVEASCDHLEPRAARKIMAYSSLRLWREENEFVEAEEVEEAIHA